MYVCNSLNRTYMYKHICNYCAISVYIFFFKKWIYIISNPDLTLECSF